MAKGCGTTKKAASAATRKGERHLLAGSVRLLSADGIVVAELVRVLGDVLLRGKGWLSST